MNKSHTFGSLPFFIICLIVTFLFNGGCDGEYYISGGFEFRMEEITFEDYEPDRIDVMDEAESDDAVTIEVMDESSDGNFQEDFLLDDNPQQESLDPCTGIVCWEHSHCVSGRCYCDDGYIDVGGACRLPDPTDPEARTEDQVCQRWRADYPETASWVWNAGSSLCDPGEVNEDARNDGVRRINLYRWLVGLQPVTRDTPEVEEAQQACAIMMYRNGTISHNPSSSWDCYTSQGASAASSSNLAMGAATPAEAVDMYIYDYGNDTTMGHRRWILYPPYSAAGIGHASSFNCLHVFSWGGSSSRQWVAFPSPGFYPVQAVLGSWTFSSSSVGSSTSVTVIKESTGVNLNVTTNPLASGYGLNTVSFNPREAVVGETYIVTVSGLSGADITYRVKIVDCS